MISKTISHYNILKKLGEGGMGEVYLAEDTKLDRKVALKFLPKEFTKDEDAKERFKREAKAAAALNHPNIVTIYEINDIEDQTYIAMEYVEGQTLKEKIQDVGAGSKPARLDYIVNIIIQICEGLQKAHEAGIVHRDIKPQNILIGSENKVKILDFGLAKLKGVSQLTKEASTIGTTHYMSPEQSLGKETDHRTDIWSLGVILYEMVTGQLPFKGDYEQAVLYSIMNEEPDYLATDQAGMPKKLRDIVKKLLKKDPDQRYQKTEYIITELQDLNLKTNTGHQGKVSVLSQKKNTLLWVGISTSILILALLYIFVLSKTSEVIEKSLAVLPFKNMSGDEQNQYFCDGITEDIITQLSKIDDLKVTSRTSVFYFKDKDLKIKDIAKELKVATILEGSVRQSKGRVRITAQLINARTDAHLWADTYDRELKDIFDIQTDVATHIAKTLKVTLFPDLQKRLNKKPTENMQAYQIYLQGKYYWNMRTPENMKRAISFFEEAVALDPNYAFGYSGLAETYVVIGDLGHLFGVTTLEKPDSAYPKAEQYCLKALSLDNELAEAYAALGEVKCDWKWDFSGAEKALKRAIELNPNYATAHQWLAEYYFILGEFRLAREAINRARELDPFSFIIQFLDAHLHLGVNNYKNSIEILNKILTKIPDFQPAHILIAQAYIWNKSYNKALHHIGMFKNPLHVLYFKCRLLAQQGEMDAAKKLSKASLSIPEIYEWPGALAVVYGDLGQIDEAVKWYKKAIDKHAYFVLFRHGFARCDALNNDPRVKQMLKEAGFENDR